ncbi:MAG: 3-hydroxyacyl-CoA dehydrogenase NAD-binding domain-containing protein [Pseudomonadota bacterium]|nr:3-hydroxyacyl-CoA dehydrogenase NAD-binding domain-containing protein [Pseudomonadota bacterium]
MANEHDKPVSITYSDTIAVITIDNSPVNALSHEVRQGLEWAVKVVNEDESLNGAVIRGAGKSFCAGADVREFGGRPRPPGLSDIIRRIEDSAKPFVALMDGVALGGGLELVLGCHYRLATRRGRMGLPEVNLGLIPGAGGTLRLPRLIGLEAAVEVITSGRLIDGAEGLSLGLVDALTDGDEVQFAIAFTRSVQSKPIQPVRLRPAPVVPSSKFFSSWRDTLTRRARGQDSPLRALDAIEFGVGVPFDEGLVQERAVFQALRDSPQSRALRHVFFAERTVTKIAGIEGARPREIDTIGIVGGGTMGTGIAVSALRAGFDVLLLERDSAECSRASAAIELSLKEFVSRSRMSESDCALACQRLVTHTDYQQLSHAQLVIEAVYEDIEVKKSVFRKLDQFLPQGTILATNTSYLDPNEIAAVTARPKDVIGLHFFSPAQLMRLLEIVRADKTHDDVVATGFALAKRLGKIGVLAGVCDGFIGNRILFETRKQLDYMLEDGALPWQIDRALEVFGMAMGPFRVMDQAGLDIGWANRQRLAATRDRRERYVEIADRLCERGWFGRKSGRGWYLYGEDGRVDPNPEVEQIVLAESARHAVKRRLISDEEIQLRINLAMINEAARVLEEGIALRPLDVDVVKVFGYGFPRWRGGPMQFADEIGLATVLQKIQNYEKEDPYFWKPAKLLKKLANNAGKFADLNKRASI